MKKKKYIKNYIINYYLKNKRSLPWRNDKNLDQDPYQTLVSEIMLQQTKVEKVKEFYKKFIKRWPEISNLANASLSDVLTEWSGLGYYRRAINLHKTANILKTNFKNKIPNEKNILKSLPGVGEYTSSAILVFAFGKFSIVLDTNIRRFIIRIFGLSDTINEKELVKYAKLIFPLKKTSLFTQGVMDYASAICTKINPKCVDCKIKKYCSYDFFDNKVSKINNKKKTKKFCYSYFVVSENKNFLIKRRPLKGILGGLFEVPTTLWCSETWPEDRFENINLSLNKCDTNFSTIIKHEFSHFTLFVKLKIIRINEKKINRNDFMWAKKKDIYKFPLSSLTKKILSHSLSVVESLK